MRRTVRRRCDALNKQVVYITKDGTTRIRSPRCRRWALAGKNRCRLHGGLSTGPKTEEGKARVISAMVEGRRAWAERMKAEGKKFPGGRKSGSKWITPRMRAREELKRIVDEAQAVENARQALSSRSYSDRVAGAKAALRALQERFDRTGSLIG
ncbi:MAG: HGGxSTG domain-containing protein [Roseiarcus sp.]|jgi:hypothetical protein